MFDRTPILCIIFVLNQTSQLVNRLQVVNLFFMVGREAWRFWESRSFIDSHSGTLLYY